ncbi:17197_t:CDS:1, partial [Racocetra persica]
QAKGEYQKNGMDVWFMKIIDLEVDNYENKDRIGNDMKKRINNRIFKNETMRIKNSTIP